MINQSHKDKIQQILSELVDKHRLVFWYNVEPEMVSLAEGLDVPGVSVLKLDNNAFTVKYNILKGQQPERGFIIYSTSDVPKDENNWLLDLQLEGIQFCADYGSLHAAECGIPFELKPKVVDQHIKFFVEPRNRERLKANIHPGMSGNDILRQMMSIIAGAVPTYDQMTFTLAEELLNGKEEKVTRLDSCNLSEIYWNDIEYAFGYTGEHSIKDLLIVLFHDDMQHILGQGRLKNEARIMMRDWRDSRQYGDTYKGWAETLQRELSIAQSLQNESIDLLTSIETFPVVDKLIANYLMPEVLNSTISVERLEDVVDKRDHKLFFNVAEHTLKALLEARRLTEDIDQKVNGLLINNVEDGINQYVNSLYTIDLHYRHYFREARNAENKDLLKPVTEMVEKTYTNKFLNVLAKKWQPLIDALSKWKFQGFSLQRDFYYREVKPFVDKDNRIYVIISDGLRYETMVELEKRIAQIRRMQTRMNPVLVAMQPSYTQLGMAALLPNKALAYPKDADDVFVDGASSKGTEARKKILCSVRPNCLAIKAEDLLQKVTNYKTFFKEYDIIYIYSNIIDKAGDNKETESTVFEATDKEIENIVRIVETIRSGNGNNILITSDHGYIYQNEELDETEFTDFKPIGDIIADSRRFVIGRNLMGGDAVKTWNSEDVGIASGRMVQICKSLNRMRKQGSGSKYVHGGSMPQEIVVPILHVNIKKANDIGQVDVEMLRNRPTITSNTKSIAFYQVDPVSEKIKPTTLRIGFYDANGNLLSDLLNVTFDSASGEHAQRETRHTFMFKGDIAKLNGQEVIMKWERKVLGSEQFAPYKEYSYKVLVSFESEW